MLKINKKWLLSLVISVILAFTIINVQAQAQARLTEQSRVTTNAIGPVKVGMTIKQANRASGVSFIQKPSGGEESGCLYYEPKTNPQDIAFMVTNKRIARIDIYNPQIMTASGAKIGDSEADIMSLYPEQIEVSDHEYQENGHYLTFVPEDKADSNYRLVFETDGQKVINYRAGKLPEVEYVEGCA